MLLERRLFFMYCSLSFFHILSLDKVFVVIVLDKFLFFIWESKKWLLVAIDSNDWTGICLGGLSSGRLTEMVVWTDLTVML